EDARRDEDVRLRRRTQAVPKRVASQPADGRTDELRRREPFEAPLFVGVCGHPLIRGDAEPFASPDEQARRDRRRHSARHRGTVHVLIDGKGPDGPRTTENAREDECDPWIVDSGERIEPDTRPNSVTGRSHVEVTNLERRRAFAMRRRRGGGGIAVAITR